MKSSLPNVPQSVFEPSRKSTFRFLFCVNIFGKVVSRITQSYSPTDILVTAPFTSAEFFPDSNSLLSLTVIVSPPNKSKKLNSLQLISIIANNSNAKY